MSNLSVPLSSKTSAFFKMCNPVSSLQSNDYKPLIPDMVTHFQGTFFKLCNPIRDEWRLITTLKRDVYFLEMMQP